ncbi:hypothetical protein PMG11_10356 [Penicillium brasilianum]|uniref:F-box domain-containing protein n=1 Tax=Penicillium brasilianum TaxID=104259 RepID=A0A0F7TYQ0_PENBI|nr:hypothetical protein PMG11_10356 [Penicillium brasilianum]
MSIIDLPLELLQLIGSDLNHKDTRNLISTSHRMHSVFQRKLYTNVTLGTKKANTAQSFLYTIARNPKLAGWVQSLALAAWETYDDWETNRKPEKTIERPNFDGALIRKIVDEASDYPEEEKSKWLQDLEEFYDDAWLALLIPRLTSLRKISFEWPFGSSHVSIMLNKAAINEGACFPHLEEVNMCWYDTENAVASYQMHPFFKFPSVRKVSGWRVAENAKEEEDLGPDSTEIPDPTEILKDLSLPPRCSNVTNIDLSKTNAAEGMREWIRACKTLKSFRIIHGGACISFDNIQPRKLYNSLSLHKSTLEAIWVEHDEYALDGHKDHEWMGSFVDFSALKFLRLSLYNLVGLKEQGSLKRKISDVISSSLDTLFLDIRWEDFCDVLDDLAEIATSGKFPTIATVHIETYKQSSSPEEDVKVEWLQQRCQEVGVACHVHDTRSREYMEGIRLRKSLWPQCEAEDPNYA